MATLHYHSKSENTIPGAGGTAVLADSIVHASVPASVSVSSRRSKRKPADDRKRDYRENASWEIISGNKRKILALGTALGDEYGTFTAAVRQIMSAFTRSGTGCKTQRVK
jgi:hypothetical protein